MSRTAKWFVHLSALAVILTGLVYGWMRYFAVSEDPYAVVNHPWQPTLQHLHILAAPILVFAVGLIWYAHIWPHLISRGRRRRTGIFLVLGLLPMVASGYLLQVSVDELWRQIWIWTHVGSSVSWAGAYAGHQLLRYGRRTAGPEKTGAAGQRPAAPVHGTS